MYYLLATSEIFSPSNKIQREVGRAKDLSAPLYHLSNFLHGPATSFNLAAWHFSVTYNLPIFPSARHQVCITQQTRHRINTFINSIISIIDRKGQRFLFKVLRSSGLCPYSYYRYYTKLWTAELVLDKS